MRTWHWFILGLALLLTACGTTPPASQPVSRLSDDQASDIAIHALGLVGTPYRWGGNTPDGGFDCSGLIGYVYQSTIGVAPPRTVAQLDGFGAQVAQGDLRTGDLVLFGRFRPTHAGHLRRTGPLRACTLQRRHGAPGPARHSLLVAPGRALSPTVTRCCTGYRCTA